jgi:hypothetical protein
MLLASIYLLKQTDKNWLTIQMIFGQVMYIFVSVIATLPVSLMIILTFANLRNGVGESLEIYTPRRRALYMLC